MKKIISYVHTHWDREWYREFQEFRLRLIEIFDEVLDLLENGNLPCFYFDGQVSALEDYLEIRNDRKSIVKSLIKQKKLFIGPFYCSSDSFLVSGEYLYRNLELGINFAKELGENDFIAYIADSFGHSKDIHFLLKAFNIKNVCLWRGLPDSKADLTWNGLHVTNLIQGYFQDFLHSSLNIEQKAKNLKNYLDKISEKSSDIILLPIGADHLACCKNIKNIIEQLNNIYNDYQITLDSPFDYFSKIKKREKIEGEFLDNSKTFLLKGVYSSRPYIKLYNAQSQWLLTRIAEPFNAISSIFFNTKDKQSEINYAYKELIKNQAHDSIYGCTIDEVYNDIVSRYKTVNTIANGVLKRNIRDLSDENGCFTVVNLSNYTYKGKIIIETEKQLPKYLNAVKISSFRGFSDKKLYDINDIPITEDVTTINKYLVDVNDLMPFSLTNITKDKICRQTFLKINKNSIENNFIKVEIKNNKIIVTDKQNNKVYNNFIIINDRADIGDSYNFGALKNDKPLKAVIKSFKIKNYKNIKAILNIVFEINIPVNSNEKGRSKKINKCKINCRFILYNQSQIAEIELEWINKSKNHILQIGFNLQKNITETISEDLFTSVKRKFNPEYDIYKNIPAAKGIEIKTNVAPLQRFINAQNLTVFTKGINEYEVSKNTLYLTILRASGIISNPNNPSRGTPAGPPIETPKLQSLGENHAYLSFSFTSDINEIYKLVEEYYYPCVTLFSNKKDCVFFKPNGKIIAVTRDDNCLITRVFDNGIKNIHTILEDIKLLM